MRIQVASTLVAACFAVASSARAADPVTWHVAPAGNDAWSGALASPNPARTDGPVASLAGAVTRVRELRAKGNDRQTALVLIQTGEYPINAPLALTPDDSGVRFEATAGARSVFNGGRRITGWQRGADGVWTTQVSDVAAGRWYCEQLWVNGRRATQARSPNEFYFYMAGKVAHGPDPLTGQPAALSSRAFKARTEDAQPLAKVPTNRLSDVPVVVYHAWEISRHRIATFDPASATVITTGGAPWAIHAMGCHPAVSSRKLSRRVGRTGRMVSRPRRHTFLPPVARRRHDKGRSLCAGRGAIRPAQR